MKSIIDSIHHLFIPKHSNNFRAKLLHHDFLTIYLIFALVLTAGISHLQNTNGSILGYATDITTTKLLELTNNERQKQGLPILKHNEKLGQAAKSKADNMFKNNYWSHYGPEGETPWEFILESGYQYEYAGENLAKNFLFSDGVVKAWMDSDSHRENILRKEYTDVGFAIVNGVLNSEETTLVVQIFGKPLYLNSNSDTKAKSVYPQKIQNNEAVTDASKNTVLADTDKKIFFPAYINLNLIFASLLILALIFDFYFASKLNLIHIKGKNLIHVFFIGFIIIGAYIIINGSIL